MPWYLKWLSNKQLINLLCKIFRKVFRSLFDEAFRLSARAQADGRFKTGFQRGQYVLEQMIENHNELREWQFVLIIAREVAHAELAKHQIDGKLVTGWEVISKYILPRIK